ncbi:MAG: DUF3842 family protein [Firmicutes bacterium]|nr:DUF3842 family protein [Bacillota bacterium]MBQ6535815.1 DUF3842 family protein [Bacillota bacterium]MBQ6606786.1 DUF3842 family protein [Bacillota bacterium]MBR0179452.1 DUF3842 family protein [Bacillota bacterium]
MNVAVIDGQGGRLGRMLVEGIIAAGIDCRITAVGTNSIATAAMLKAGAQAGATGENPVLVAARDADVIIGPLGLLVADSLLGEITPAMAQAVGRSQAVKLLLPVNMCNNRVVGAGVHSFAELVNSAVSELAELARK